MAELMSGEPMVVLPRRFCCAPHKALSAAGLLADLDEQAPHSTKLYAWSLLVSNGLIAPEVWLERDMSNTLLLYHPVPCLRALLAFGQRQCQAVLSVGEQAASIQQHVTQQVTYEAC